MNTNRIKALLRYDLVIFKQKLSMTVVLIALIYLCFALLTYYLKRLYMGEVNPELPTILAQFIQGYFSYAEFAMVIVITTMLHHKFTNPRSATSYLSMPGTSLEKWTVMLTEYIGGAIVVGGLYILCHAATMFVGWLLSPDLHWMVNPIGSTMDKVNNYLFAMNGQTFDEIIEGLRNMEGDPAASVVANKIMTTVQLYIYFAPVFSIVFYMIYICLNMCFRTNGQIKSIALLFGSSFFLAIIMTVSLVLFFINVAETGDVSAAEIMLGKLASVCTIVDVLIYISPAFIVGLAYLFYRQICRKQAK